MYIQDLIKSLTIFCISLLICIPFAISVDIDFISDISEEGDFLDGGESDFIINVKYYEPRPLTSSTIEKGRAPVFIHLMAIPNFPTQSLPRIQRVSVRETGSDFLTGSIRYNKPAFYTWDNFGFLQVNIKQIKNEDEVPDIIKANLTARIQYETDVIPGLLVGGAMSKTLKKYTKEKILWNDITGEEEYMFFGGRGYIVVKEIQEKRVQLVLFNSVGRKQSITIDEGREKGPYHLVSGSTDVQNQVRIRVDNINYVKGNLDNTVSLALMAGKRKGESEVDFKLNIPVDKRLFNLTHDDIREEINWTIDQIEDLNRTIDNLEEQIEWFYDACLLTTALVVVGRLFGIGKTVIESTVKEEVEKAVVGEIAKASAEETVKTIDGEEDLIAGFKKQIGGEEVTTKVIDNEAKTIYSSSYGGENLLLIPIQDTNNLQSIFTVVKTWGEDPKNELKHVYAAYSDKKGLTFYIREGSSMDVGVKVRGDKDQLLDLPITTYPMKSIQYSTFTSHYVRPIQKAQRDKKPFEIGGNTYNGVDTTRSILSDKASLACTDFMSPTQCKLIHNFCDPVVCPVSRCSFKESIKGTVQEAGLFVSLFGFLQNFKEDNVMVPFCLTGIQASLKNIRSYLQGYERCLKTRLENGESVGLCDRTRSVFMCEIVWRHFLDPAFNWIGGKIGSRSAIAGGEAYKDVKGGVDKAKTTLDYFTRDYAKNIVAGYKGKFTKEIGTSLCQSAISGKFPNFGEILEDLAESGTPTQYTAQFEEHPYSAATGNSRYFGYYHIYAGSVEDSISYAVYLKNCGGKNIQVKRGTIQPEDFADETFEQIGTSGCKEICVVVGGETNCAFGKMVSTNVVIQDAVDSFVASQAGKQIELERDCIPTGEAYLGASVNRQCAIVKPLGNWVNAGSCKKSLTDDRDTIPDCWTEIDTQDKDLIQQVQRNVCSGNICNRNNRCEGEFTGIQGSFDVCCSGNCKEEEFVAKVREILGPSYIIKGTLQEKTGLIHPSWEYLDKWYDAGLKKTGDVDNRGIIISSDDQIRVKKLIQENPDGVYYYLAMTFLYDADYENAEKIAFKINNDIDIFDEVSNLIGDAWRDYDTTIPEKDRQYSKYEERRKAKLETFKSRTRTGVGETAPIVRTRTMEEVEGIEVETTPEEPEKIEVGGFKVGEAFENNDDIENKMKEQGFSFKWIAENREFIFENSDGDWYVIKKGSTLGTANKIYIIAYSGLTKEGELISGLDTYDTLFDRESSIPNQENIKIGDIRIKDIITISGTTYLIARIDDFFDGVSPPKFIFYDTGGDEVLSLETYSLINSYETFDKLARPKSE